MYRHKILNEIEDVSRAVGHSEFTRLRIKEELLSLLVNNPGQTLKIKKEAFEAIERINRKQLEILGQLAKS